MSNMSVSKRQITANPSDLITPESAEFICRAVGDTGRKRESLYELLTTDPDAWLMLDDPWILHALAEACVEKAFPRLGYYALLRHYTAKEGIHTASVAAYMSCLLEAAEAMGNPFFGDVALPLVIQNDRQKCVISSESVRRRLHEKTAHICLLVLTLYRKNMNRDHRLNEGPDAGFYYKNATYCLHKLSDYFNQDGDEDLRDVCAYMADNVVQCMSGCLKGIRSGLISPPRSKP